VQAAHLDAPLRIADISRCSTIASIKKLIEKSTSIAVCEQDLIFTGAVLQNKNTLFDYGINYNDIVQLMIKKGQQNGTESENGTNEIENIAEPLNKKIKVDPSSMFEEVEVQSTKNFRVNDIVDVMEDALNAWFEASIIKIVQKPHLGNEPIDDISDENFFYHIKYLDEPDADPLVVDTMKNIRFRAYHVIPCKDLQVGQKVLVNYHLDKKEHRGNWMDAIISKNDDSGLFADVFIKENTDPLKNCKIFFVDEVFRIETCERHDDLNQEPINLRENRPHCDTCLDKPGVNCKSCNCCICGSPENPDKQILCDECDKVYHMDCLKPKMETLPENDWYCNDCRNDEDNKIVKKVQRKSVGADVRDWGRGMACVSRTTQCTIVPANHIGKIPGVPVGSTWKFRMQASEAGVHRPHVAGIAGREIEGAFSIVLSGGYEDDLDHGEEFYYTGSGGRDLSGNKRTSVQSFDQDLTRGNGALARSCNLDFAKNKLPEYESPNWKDGMPVRVIRSWKFGKKSKFAPIEGIRYDGLYKVVKYWQEKGASGHIVYRYLLRRDDPEPAPWTPEGIKRSEDLGLTCVYPDGYGEKAAEQLANKENKRLASKLNVNNDLHPVKKSPAKKFKISSDISDLISEDSKNSIKWTELMKNEFKNQKAFIDEIVETFTCICCYNVVSSPVTLPDCKHNICRECLDYSIKISLTKCPVCRADIEKHIKEDALHENEQLTKILSFITSQ